MHEAPAKFHQSIQRMHRRTLRGQRWEFIAMFEEPFELEFRIGGVILGPTGREGLANFGHRERVYGEEHEKVIVAQRRNKGTLGRLQQQHEPTPEAGAERTRPSIDRLSVCSKALASRLPVPADGIHMARVASAQSRPIKAANPA